MRSDLWRHWPVISKLVGSQNPLARRSFLGLGAQSPTISWGAMLADGQTFLAIAPWVAVFPWERDAAELSIDPGVDSRGCTRTPSCAPTRWAFLGPELSGRRLCSVEILGQRLVIDLRPRRPEYPHG